MSTYKFTRVFNRLLRRIFKLQKLLLQAFYSFLRSFFVSPRQQRQQRQAGFVLPTTALMLVVVSLVIAALILRSLSRSTQVIGERQQQVIYNAASPAIDRARAKLEYMFDVNSDSRLPSGVPTTSTLLGIMLNDSSNNVPQLLVQGNDPYTLPDETRLDLDGDGVADNAWSFKINANGGNAPDTTVAYSIIWSIPSPTAPQQLNDTSNAAVMNRSQLLQVRTGPLTGQPLLACPSSSQPTGQGWFTSNATLSKNFQIDAVVIPINQQNGTGVGNTLSTLELEQDRQINQGNTWGAWFRNDLEIYPGSNFNWNGAMHTEGNLIVASDNSFNGFLISSPSSCLYLQGTSQVSVGQPNPTNKPAVNGGVAFRGQIVNGSMKFNSLSGNAQGPGDPTDNGLSIFHLFNGAGNPPIAPTTIQTINGNATLQNVTAAGAPGTSTNATLSPLSPITASVKNITLPADIALDPVALFTQGISQARPVLSSGSPNTDQTNLNKEDPGWNSGSFNSTKRVYRQTAPAPFVDDTYRADNRYGPKPAYGRSAQQAVPGKIGVPIPNSLYSQLLSETPTNPADITTVGLDGYWERRARNEGLRIIVGQRLELGNAFGWGANSSDPLYPPQGKNITNEARQRRSQRDNLAAVQSTAIYHYTQPQLINGGYFPVACLGTTYHPGTQTTATNSKNSSNLNSTSFFPNFFNGQSTNVGEYFYPSSYNSESAFASAINSITQQYPDPLVKALTNLAYFAGDPNGGTPSYTPLQTTDVHPYSYQSMWGDFSYLRRIIDALKSGASVYSTANPLPANGLSIADRSYLHTAACTIGLLATSMTGIQNQVSNSINDPNFLTNISTLATALNSIPTPPANAPSPPPPEYYIQWLQANSSPAVVQLAQQIMLYLQIQRDRHLGFVSGNISLSPTADPFISNLNSISLTSAQRSVLLQKLSPVGPKYPSLFYIFPAVAHDYMGNNGNTPPSPAYDPNNGSPIALTQPPSELYVSPPSTNPPSTTTYMNQVAQRNQGLSSSQLYLYTDLNRFQIASLSLITQSKLPLGAFKETAFFNGREMMNTRVMDVNLGLLRTNSPPNASNEYWLPNGGIIYAFREDTVREDSIVRPAGSGMCLTTTQCPSATTLPTDPLIGANGITTKPVDFYADPERRPNGFRLFDGIRIDRQNSNIGMTFVSDDIVYIKGDFNFHSNNGTTNNLEEFMQTLNQPAWDNFYNRTTRNPNFAKPSVDTWRPAEILADAVSILSSDFVDGYIEDGIRATQQSSYINQNPINNNNPGSYWIRENAYDSNSPIVISQNGNPVYCTAASTTPSSPCPSGSVMQYSSYQTFTNGRNLPNAVTPMQVNATIISGTVASQIYQGYGGLHNFPRFLENWNGQPLIIAGSFLQLNFSTSATAPYDQDAWEPPAAPVKAEPAPYYSPPARYWGYDVGLQIAAAAPAAQRFVTSSRTRNEFYQELPATDPYICRLRRATVLATSQPFDPNANSTNCP